MSIELTEAVKIWTYSIKIHTWLHLLSISLVACFMITRKRWSDHIWLKTYIASYLLLVALYAWFFYGNYQFYVLMRYTLYLLLAGTAYDVLRRDKSGPLPAPKWLVPAISIILIHNLLVAFFPGQYFHNGTPWFYIPRVVLFAGLASLWERANSAKNYPLMYLGFLGIGTIIADALKLTLNGIPIYKVQLWIEPWIPTTAAAILCYGAVKPYAIKALNRLLPAHTTTEPVYVADFIRVGMVSDNRSIYIAMNEQIEHAVTAGLQTAKEYETVEIFTSKKALAKYLRNRYQIDDVEAWLQVYVRNQMLVTEDNNGHFVVLKEDVDKLFIF